MLVVSNIIVMSTLNQSSWNNYIWQVLCLKQDLFNLKHSLSCVFYHPILCSRCYKKKKMKMHWNIFYNDLLYLRLPFFGTCRLTMLKNNKYIIINWSNIKYYVWYWEREEVNKKNPFSGLFHNQLYKSLSWHEHICGFAPTEFPLTLSSLFFLLSIRHI